MRYSLFYRFRDTTEKPTSIHDRITAQKQGEKIWLDLTEVRNEARRVVYETMIVVREQLNEALGCHIRIGDFKFLITAIMDKLNKGITGNSSETRKNSAWNFKTAHYQFFLTFLIFRVYEHPGNSRRDVFVRSFQPFQRALHLTVSNQHLQKCPKREPLTRQRHRL